jgi:hypothetical protein
MSRNFVKFRDKEFPRNTGQFRRDTENMAVKNLTGFRVITRNNTVGVGCWISDIADMKTDVDAHLWSFTSVS